MNLKYPSFIEAKGNVIDQLPLKLGRRISPVSTEQSYY